MCGNSSPLEGGTCTIGTNLYGKSFEGIPKIVYFQFSQNMDGFRQNDSQTTELLEFIKLCKQKPLEKFFIFTKIYQNYTLAFILSQWMLGL